MVTSRPYPAGAVRTSQLPHSLLRAGSEESHPHSLPSVRALVGEGGVGDAGGKNSTFETREGLGVCPIILRPEEINCN